MALSPLEIVVIIGIIAVIFLWGPQKLPELARSIGLAKKEFEKAGKEFTGTISGTSTPQQPQAPAEDDTLLQTAWRLGIKTEGKTKEQISQEIVEKAGTTKSQATTA